MFKKNAYQFTAKKKSTDSVIALIFGILSLVSLVVEIVESVITKGQVSKYVAYLGVVSFVLAFLGSVFSVLGWKAEEGSIVMKRFTIILNFLLTGIFLILFIKGIF